MKRWLPSLLLAVLIATPLVVFGDGEETETTTRELIALGLGIAIMGGYLAALWLRPVWTDWFRLGLLANLIVGDLTKLLFGDGSGLVLLVMAFKVAIAVHTVVMAERLRFRVQVGLALAGLLTPWVVLGIAYYGTALSALGLVGITSYVLLRRHR